jgi:hypothetical protein
MIGFERRHQWRQHKLFKLRAKLLRCEKTSYYKSLAAKLAPPADLDRIQNLRFAYLLCVAQNMSKRRTRVPMAARFEIRRCGGIRKAKPQCRSRVPQERTRRKTRLRRAAGHSSLPCYAVEYSKDDNNADPVSGKRAHLTLPLSCRPTPARFGRKLRYYRIFQASSVTAIIGFGAAPLPGLMWNS